MISNSYYTIKINIDLYSQENYSNQECGGSIDITGKDITKYPPCKTFLDAGIRSLQVINENPETIIKSLEFIVENLENEVWPTVYVTSPLDIMNYCTFELKFANQTLQNTDYFIVIDGLSMNPSGNSFFRYISFENNDLCPKKQVTLRNLYLFGFGSSHPINNVVRNIKTSNLEFNFQRIHSMFTTFFNGWANDGIIEFNQNEKPIQITIRNCTFESMYYDFLNTYYSNITLESSTFKTLYSYDFPFYLRNSNLTVENVIFDDLSLDLLIYIDSGSFRIANTRFINSALNTITYFYSGSSQYLQPSFVTNCSFSDSFFINYFFDPETYPDSFNYLFTIESDIEMDPVFHLVLQDITFTNNEIYSFGLLKSINSTNIQISIINTTLPLDFSRGFEVSNNTIKILDSQLETNITILGSYNIIKSNNLLISNETIESYLKDCEECIFLFDIPEEDSSNSSSSSDSGSHDSSSHSSTNNNSESSIEIIEKSKSNTGKIIAIVVPIGSFIVIGSAITLLIVMYKKRNKNNDIELNNKDNFTNYLGSSETSGDKDAEKPTKKSLNVFGKKVQSELD
ncbi:hypothetical protein DICPUDRAFT_152045 [Dictyostelium purpureum]|uniref:Uncharacterized protein n=1 Tax=Dictyostelium purpureum TaxID=5786 RepID=F0ZKC1_DICPU|nr:uncharacterized protein DICPUDRAFT_152045 [Dictyostelium purpureum]EGC35619.1 hypothetical protein DICPUDRAFT_152045 [Dictyostelium purpureum]|eukprot:XP_003287856.1 hypothetical protein DICPUDRAFT_152045 [Dictyostelium purpureum]